MKLVRILPWLASHLVSSAHGHQPRLAPLPLGLGGSADGHYAQLGSPSAAIDPIDQRNRLTSTESSMGPAPQGSANVVVSVHERAHSGGRPEVSGCERSPEPPKKHSRQESRGTKRMRTVSRTTAITIMSLLIMVLTATTSQAAIVHNFEPTPTKEISTHAPSCTGPGSVTGALGEVNAMTVDPQEPVGGAGHLWLAERLGEGSKERVDELNASSGACEQQLGNAGSLQRAFNGVAVSHVTGEREVYVGAYEDRTTKTEAVVGVFGSSGALQSVWTGAHTPQGAFNTLTVEGEKYQANVSDVAVDGSVNAETEGDVYVAVEMRVQSTRGVVTSAVDVFKPEAALHGAEPASTLAQLTGTCQEAGEVATGIAACTGSTSVPFEEVRAVAVDPGNGDVLVGSGHVVDVFEPVAMHEYRYVRQVTGTSETQPFAKGITAIAVGGGAEEGDVYVTEEGQLGVPPVVYQFNHEGVLLATLEGTPSGPFVKAVSLAVDPVSHDVFVGDEREAQGEGGVVDVFGKDLVVPDVRTEAASEETPRSATLNGKVSPLTAETGEAATCQFVWGTSEAFGQPPVECEQGEITADETPVTAKLTKLQPDTTYYYQLQAKNAKGTNRDGAVLHFTTPGPGIVEASVSKVASTSATLDATLEPHGVATSYRFEYDTRPYAPEEAPHGTAVPVPDEAIGSTPAAVKVEQHIQGLSAGRTYYYRVVTIAGEEFDGEGHSFTTQGAGEFVLPDARSYEMVSPPAKDGALLDGIGQPSGYNGGVIQAAADGDALTYVATFPTEPEPAGYANETQVFSARGSEGTWQTRDLTIPHAGATTAAVSSGLEYRFFSETLSSAIVQPFGSFIALSPQASEQTAYLHDNQSGAYTPLVTDKEGFANDTASPFKPFGEFGNKGGGGAQEEGETCPPALECGPDFLDATPDNKHVVLLSKDALTKTPLPENPATHTVPRQLYEWNGAEPPSRQLQLVSLLPEGEEGGAPPTAGARLGSAARGAISGDGSRVFFSTYAGGLYMRDVPGEKTIRLDLPEAGCGTCGGTAGAGFQFASPDGSRVLFSDGQRLTGDSGASPSKPDLYECVISEATPGAPACALADLTPRGASGESASLQGAVVGSSVDGSYVYFVADGVLENNGIAVPGAVHGDCTEITTTTFDASCNLYVRHEGTTSLVAVLSGTDFSDWSGGGRGLVGLTARVSPDGRYLAFMSDRELTGYDNHDAASGAPDEELYEYDAATGRTSCASCDPSGARPTGEEFGQEGANTLLAGEGAEKLWEARSWLAATVPGWTPIENGTARYQSRYLSNTGRLFFNAHAPLVPADVNNQWDVYEFEPEGVGGCTSSTSSGSDVFKPAHAFETEAEGIEQAGEEAAGCVGLISNGESKDESAFLDASETGGEGPHGEELKDGGGDVFFLTTSKLAPQDVDDSYDIYDAHECTTESPCTQPATSPPPCENEASCKPAPTPQPGIYGPPASATFSGPGNLTPQLCPSSGSSGSAAGSSSASGSGSSAACGSKPPPAPSCSSSLGAPSTKCTKGQNLKKALATCKRKYPKSKKKRGSCERTARHRYTAKKASAKKPAGHG